MEYIGKDGRTYHIGVDSVYWIKNHADLLDEDVNKFLWAAVSEGNFDIHPTHILRFLVEHENFPELEKVIQIDEGTITLPLPELTEYIDEEDVDRTFDRTTEKAINIVLFYNIFRGHWDVITTPDHRSFNSPYDSLIIAHRISGLEMDTVLTWFFLTKYGWNDSSSVDDIVKYCHKYADDPKLFKEV